MSATKKKPYQYVSPFIKNAEKQARLRAKDAAVKIRRQRMHAALQSDWNSDTHTDLLFDETKKKKQGVSPKVSIGPLRRTEGRDSAAMTMKTTGVSPRRKPSFDRRYVDASYGDAEKENDTHGQSRHRIQHPPIPHYMLKTHTSDTDDVIERERRIHERTMHDEEEMARHHDEAPTRFHVDARSVHDRHPFKGMYADAYATDDDVIANLVRNSAAPTDNLGDKDAQENQDIESPERPADMPSEKGVTRSTSPIDDRLVRLLVGPEIDPDTIECARCDAQDAEYMAGESAFLADQIESWMPPPSTDIPLRGEGGRRHSVQMQRSVAVGDDTPAITKPKRPSAPSQPNVVGTEVLASTARILEAVGGMVTSLTYEQRRRRFASQRGAVDVRSVSPTTIGSSVYNYRPNENKMAMEYVLREQMAATRDALKATGTPGKSMKMQTTPGGTPTTRTPSHKTAAPTAQKYIPAPPDPEHFVRAHPCFTNNAEDMYTKYFDGPRAADGREAGEPEQYANLSPAAVMDLVLAKIQAMESTEADALKTLHMQTGVREGARGQVRVSFDYKAALDAEMHTGGAVNDASATPYAWHNLAETSAVSPAIPRDSLAGGIREKLRAAPSGAARSHAAVGDVLPSPHHSHLSSVRSARDLHHGASAAQVQIGKGGVIVYADGAGTDTQLGPNTPKSVQSMPTPKSAQSAPSSALSGGTAGGASVRSYGGYGGGRVDGLGALTSPSPLLTRETALLAGDLGSELTATSGMGVEGAPRADSAYETVLRDRVAMECVEDAQAEANTHLLALLDRDHELRPAGLDRQQIVGEAYKKLILEPLSAPLEFTQEIAEYRQQLAM